MGIFDFFRDKGKDVEAETTVDTAEAIQTMLETVMPGQIKDLVVTDTGGEVTLIGVAQNEEVREKAILMAGNVKGVSSVNDDALMVEQVEEKPEPTFYTIQKGDSLSKIAKAEYGDAMKWKALFAANEGIIEDPDLIYPGQVIRIPDNV
jgi:nucleoid-associated protein YgaU